MKNFAVCVSGCPRSWRQGLGTHEELRVRLEQEWEEPIKFTYFMEFWDFCCPSINYTHYADILKKYNYSAGSDSREFTFPFSLQEQAELVDTYRPEYVRFRSKSEMLNVERQREGWLYPGGYLMNEVLKQRRMYENIHSEFDLCIWCRSDIEILLSEDRLNFPKEPKGIAGTYMYRHGKSGKLYEAFRDLFFYGKPGKVDLAATIYPQGYLPRNHRIYTDAGYIEEEYYANLLAFGIPVENLTSCTLSISRYFEDSLLRHESNLI